MVTLQALRASFRDRRRDAELNATSDAEASARLADLARNQALATDYERRSLCDDAWALIDPNSGWSFHKKCSVMKFFWTVVMTMGPRT